MLGTPLSQQRHEMAPDVASAAGDEKAVLHRRILKEGRGKPNT